MLRRLSTIFDPFLLALASTVAIASLFPAHGDAAHAASDAAESAIALLFFLYGARLSPQQAWHGVRQWKLHLLVLSMTFLFFPLLGLAARVLVPSVLTTDLYNGVLSSAWSRPRCSRRSPSLRLRGAMFRPPSSVPRCRTFSALC